MPFRALLWTLLTVALALVVVGMWLRVVEPMLATAQEAEKTPGVYPTSQPVGATQPVPPPPPVLQRIVVKTTLLIAFILVSFLLVIGFLAMFREWVRFHSGEWKKSRSGPKTHYVDAWKIAGERLKAKEQPLEDDDEDDDNNETPGDPRNN